ncbi:hypothetical protein AAG570_002099 [Ranatra chinensis]|uniref:CCHC-type domain-containing protein n=1 Tax=Ranatra chinensis TaxID=642074 RepID=A0ABD0YAF2_9HEMI
METQAPSQRTVDVNTVSGLASTAILNMPEFTGDPERLADFLEAASAAGAHLRAVNTLLPPEVINNIYGILIRKISHQLLASSVSGTEEPGDRQRGRLSILAVAESRYSAIERELLGVVWAVEHFRPYVWGRQFRIKTDHKPLVWVEGLRETSARITRWKERLAPYAFQITHTKGKDNVVADCLSRMVNAIDSPSPTLDVHEGVEWDPGSFDLSLLGPPGGEKPEPPGLSLLRRRAEEGPDLPAVPEAAARLSPVSRPASGRGSAGQRRLMWEVGALNDKARQLSVEIVPGADVRTSCHRGLAGWTPLLEDQIPEKDSRQGRFKEDDVAVLCRIQASQSPGTGLYRPLVSRDHSHVMSCRYDLCPWEKGVIKLRDPSESAPSEPAAVLLEEPSPSSTEGIFFPDWQRTTSTHIGLGAHNCFILGCARGIVTSFPSIRVDSTHDYQLASAAEKTAVVASYPTHPQTLRHSVMPEQSFKNLLADKIARLPVRSTNRERQRHAQQAMMAAQATTQSITVEDAAEGLQRMNILMLYALNIPEFDGDLQMLPNFIEREIKTDPVKAQTAIELVKQLVGERIRREMQERIKKVLKTATPLRLDETIGRIREENEEFQEEKRSGENWAVVEGRQPRKEHMRTDHRQWRELREKQGSKKWKSREEYKTREKKHYRDDRRETRRCYQCRDRGHLARSCPYIRRSSGYRDGTEPIEINQMNLVKTYDSHRNRYVWVNRRDESGSSEEDSTLKSSSGEESVGSKKGSKKPLYADTTRKKRTDSE